MNLITGRNIQIAFGRNSELYNEVISIINDYYNQKFGDSEFQNCFLIWERNLFSLYSKSKEKINLFLNHIYIIVLVEQITKKFNESQNISSEIYIRYIFLKNAFFQKNKKLEFINHFSTLKYYDSICLKIDVKLGKFHYGQIKEDLFSEIYQDLILKGDRHKIGEYYTPKWIVEFLIEELFQYYGKNGNLRSVLDPTCGSGTFLVHFIMVGLKNNVFKDLIEIFENIHGHEINPISAYISLANYLLIIPSKFFDLKDENLLSIKSPIKILDIIAYSSLDHHLNPIKRYDILIGNPPWISLNSIGNIKTQESIKKEIFHYRLISKKNTHLFTQIEVAILIFCKTVDKFLKKGGAVCYIMPKSVLAGTKQNEVFKQFKNPLVDIKRIYDLQKVKNLFGMPGCILFGIKGSTTNYPVFYRELEGNSFFINNDISNLVMNDSVYSPPEFGLKTSNSYYYNKFKVGASIFPRNLYFVKIIDMNEKYYHINTDNTIDSLSKINWKGISLNGHILKKFLFVTLLAWELIPFGYTKLREIALPIEVEKNGEIKNSLHDLDRDSDNWFSEVNKIWKEKSTEKSKIRFPNIQDRLNYNQLLVKQKLEKFIVLYSGTGTNICSCVIDRHNLIEKNITKNLTFIADVKTWIYETKNELEAHYLCSILNSPILNDLIKPLQPQGLGGGRAIHRRPFKFNIPKFNDKISNHLELSNLSIKNHGKIVSINLPEGLKSRRKARTILNDELEHINKIAINILKE